MSNPAQQPPIAALAALYLLYLGAIGVFATYVPLHLAAVGLSASQIGLLFSGRSAVTLLSQPVVTSFADRIGRPDRVMQLCLFGALLVAALGPWASEVAPQWRFAAWAVVFWAMAPMSSSVVPLIDAEIVRARGSRGYGTVRLWGSIGFGVAVWGFGALTGHLDESIAGGLSVGVLIVLLGVAALVSWRLPRGRGRVATDPPVTPGRSLITPVFATFLLCHLLHWSSVTAYNLFLSLHVAEHGWSTAVTGQAVAVAIVAEIIGFRLATRLVGDDGERMLPIVFVVSAARWVATAYAPSPGVLVALQAAHVLGFGLWYASAIAAMGRFAPLRLRSTLQGTFAAVVFAGGGILGSAGGGALIDAFGTRGAFLGAAVAEGAALAVALVAIPAWRRVSPPVDEPAGDAAS